MPSSQKKSSKIQSLMRVYEAPEQENVGVVGSRPNVEEARRIIPKGNTQVLVEQLGPLIAKWLAGGDGKSLAESYPEPRSFEYIEHSGNVRSIIKQLYHSNPEQCQQISEQLLEKSKGAQATILSNSQKICDKADRVERLEVEIAEKKAQLAAHQQARVSGKKAQLAARHRLKRLAQKITNLRLPARRSRQNKPLSLTPLHIAVRDENIDNLKRLLKEQPQLINVKTEHDWLTALHYAVYNDNLKIVLILLQSGARQLPNKKGFTPVQICSEGAIKDALINHQQNSRESPLRPIATQPGNDVQIKSKALSRPHITTRSGDSSSLPRAPVAVQPGNTSQIKREALSRPYITTCSGNSSGLSRPPAAPQSVNAVQKKSEALSRPHITTHSGNSRVLPRPPVATQPVNAVQIKSEALSRPRITTRSGDSSGLPRPPAVAQSGNAVQIKIQALSRPYITTRSGTSSGLSELHKAAQSGNIAQIKKCLIDGVPVNQESGKGMNALHYYLAAGINTVSVKDAEEVIRLFIEKGADVNAKTRTGDRTPLHYLGLLCLGDEFPSYYGLVKLLLDHGADPELKDSRQCSFLQLVNMSKAELEVKLGLAVYSTEERVSPRF